MGASEKAVAAVMRKSGCDPYRGAGDADICVVVGHDEPWTDRGCPVAVAAADLAVDTDRPSIQAQAITSIADQWQQGDWIMVLPASLGPKVVGLGQRVTEWLRARADQIEGQP